ncbi:acetylcholinesterase-1 [Caerostris darwini]|uniref:Acetylcholinesterase-1 n=1 Tax=Caerostris darwini TaxID=1538125 RepID=A0AAV4ME84_9ARAC|nr:acetylcholinesterase-1 [Caerostris darwini]
MGIIVFLIFSLSILGCIQCQSDFSETDDDEPDNLDDGVMTKSGKIVGKITQFYGVLTRAYLGVPYAKAPVGDLRFKKPQPIEPWSDTLVADTMPPACVQYSKTYVPWYDDDRQSEDCLYMNIWSPRNVYVNRNLSVMLWIHGGEFTVGSNKLPATNGQGLSLFGASLVVAPNYRLGAMGFLSSGTEDAPGNMGIHDIIMALKWIRENIAAFKGDPDRITIFGQGSGAVTVSMFLMSPLTQGLYQRAILQSGAFFSNKPDPNEYNLDMGQKLAVAVDCASENQTLRDNPKEVVDCLRDVDPTTLAVTLSSFNPTVPKSFLPIYGDDFLPKSPAKYLKTGQFHDVDIIIGVNKQEGSYLLVTEYPEIFGDSGDAKIAIPKSFGQTILRRMFKDLKDPEEIVDQYLGELDEQDTDEVKKQVYTAMGDYSVTCPSLYFAEQYNTGNNSVKFYVFDQRPSDTQWAKWMGTTHYDEVAMVFARPIDGYDYDSFTTSFTPEMAVSFTVSHMWGKFADLGVTDSYWKPFTKYHHQYVLISMKGKRKMSGPGPHLDNCNFFRKHFGV